MARTNCKVCQREDKDDLELMAIEKGPRKTAKFIGCSHNAVMRHMDNHTEKKAFEEPKVIQHHRKKRLQFVPEEPEKPAQPAPMAPPVSRVPSPPEDASYKGRRALVAAMKTPRERKAYLTELFQQGRFHGIRTSGLLSVLWSDLGPIEFAELISQVALEVNFRRGSEQAKRLVLLGKVETLFHDAMKANDRRTAARLIEIWAKLDVPIGADLLTALASTASWPLVARELQTRFPDAFEAVYGVLVAEEQRKRQAMAPPAIEASPE